MTRPVALLTALSLSALLVAGCATDGEQRSGERSDRGVRAGGISGGGAPDWEERPSLIRDLLGSDDDDQAAEEERIAELEEQIRELREERSHRTDDRAPVSTETPRKRIGVVLDGDSGELSDALRAVALDHPLVVLSDERTREALDDAGCDPAAIAECAEGLALYPGLRAVLRVSVDGAQATWSSYDTVLDEQHRERVSELPTVDDAIPERAWRAFSDQALLTVADRLDTAPWHARGFSEEEDGWVINAGEASGLETGDRLVVRGAPTVIHSPNDRPIGWRAGSRKGIVEVSDFAGSDLAVVTLVDGEGPAEEDVLLPEE